MCFGRAHQICAQLPIKTNEPWSAIICSCFVEYHVWEYHSGILSWNLVDKVFPVPLGIQNLERLSPVCIPSKTVHTCLHTESTSVPMYRAGHTKQHRQTRSAHTQTQMAPTASSWPPLWLSMRNVSVGKRPTVCDWIQTLPQDFNFYFCLFIVASSQQDGLTLISALDRVRRQGLWRGFCFFTYMTSQRSDREVKVLCRFWFLLNKGLSMLSLHEQCYHWELSQGME